MEDNIQPLETSDNDRVIQVNIEEQMKTAYIDYSMSVIVGRACLMRVMVLNLFTAVYCTR